MKCTIFLFTFQSCLHVRGSCLAHTQDHAQVPNTRAYHTHARVPHAYVRHTRATHTHKLKYRCDMMRHYPFDKRR